MNQGHQRRPSQQNLHQNGLNGSSNRTPPLMGSSSPLAMGLTPPILPTFQLNPELSNTNDNIGSLGSTSNNVSVGNIDTQQQQALKKASNTVVYGFVYWIATFVGYIIYLLWAFIPEDVLHGLGMYYYPSKYWAVAIPMYLVVCILFGLSVYFSINLIITQPLDSANTFKDQYSQYESSDGGNEGHIYLPESIPPLEDIPIQLINQLLYQKRPKIESTPSSTNLQNTLRSKPPPLNISNLSNSSSPQNTSVFKPTTPPSNITRRNPLNLSTQSTSLLKTHNFDNQNNE